MYKIGICGAHGTGKSTLLEALNQELKLPVIKRTMRTLWEKFGIDNFEKIPADIRANFQKYALLNQIDREDNEGQDGFISDRTVLDNLAYTKLNADMSQSDFRIYERLVKERLKNYTHFIYLPIEFGVEPEHLRADLGSRHEIAAIIESYLAKWFTSGDYLVARGSVSERVQQVKEFLRSKT
jgi:deoxyadenosine/deoxycytidine kinase